MFYSYLECHVIISFSLARSSLFSQAFMGTEHPRDGEAALSSQRSTNSLTLQQEEKALYCSLYSHALGKGLWISLECIFWFGHLFSSLQYVFGKVSFYRVSDNWHLLLLERFSNTANDGMWISVSTTNKKINIFSKPFVEDIVDSAQNNYMEKLIIPSVLLTLFSLSCNVLSYYKDDSTVPFLQVHLF